jgi:type IV pilus assembly protein PilW
MMKGGLKNQKGLSLIELMIAITLSIFIVAAMISLFVNSKQNYRMNENMSRLQENARFAVSFLSRDIRMADYRACVTEDRLPNGSGLPAIAGQDGTAGAPDTITVRWQSNACGIALAPETTVFSIQTGASGSPALFRSVNGDAAEELVEGIEDLQILYGQDTDNDDVPNYFVDAATITDMAQAVSVRITLVARTLESNLAADGGRITRAFTSTVTLRNRLP